MKHSVCAIFFIQLWFSIVCGEVDSADRFNCTDPDDYLTTPQIIARHGYQAESHIVTTEDGYLLTVHRISVSKNGTRGKQPVFLQHGLLGSSADWVDGGNESLAFFLSDAGYDVWLGNARGNVYSRAHVNLSTSSAAFWNFSWHEMGVYDLPAVVYHISNTTGQGGHILYVGHSMGTTMFFVFSSMKPQVAKNIRIMVALAPVAYMTHIKSPIRYLSPWVNDFEFIQKYLGINQFLPTDKIKRLLARDCDKTFSLSVCDDIIFVMFGYDKDQITDEIMQRLICRGKAGASTKTILHYLQEIQEDGNFQNFDYGPNGNTIMYNMTSPPFYPLKYIDVPTFLMFADNDMVVSPIDAKRLSNKLTKNIGVYEVPFPKFNHVDFLWGKDAPELVYNKLLNQIKNYTQCN